MKKISILIIAFVAFLGVQHAQAWQNLAHGTVAYIAEQHLTPEAKAKCHYYLRHSLSFYASWMDQWRGVEKYKDVNNAHSGVGLDDGVHYDMKSGTPAGRVVGHLVNALAELGDGKYKNLPDSVVRQRLVNMAHYVGDMHCPSHTNFSKEAYPQYRYQLLKNGKKFSYHTFWDTSIGLKNRWNWTYEQLAAEIDVLTPEQVAKIQSGSIEDWTFEFVQYGHRARKLTPPGTDVAHLTSEQEQAAAALADEAVVVGGYRLAYILNTIFADKNIPVYNKK